MILQFRAFLDGEDGIMAGEVKETRCGSGLSKRIRSPMILVSRYLPHSVQARS